MKAKEARELLKALPDKDLYSKARELYLSEGNKLITLRAHGAKPSINLVSSSIEQMSQWFLKVTKGLPFESSSTPTNIIKWSRGSFFIKYNLLDPTVGKYIQRTRGNILRGTPLPAFEALDNESLEALSSMMMANIGKSLEKTSVLINMRKDFASSLKKLECPYGADERFCPYQETYVLNPEGLLTSTSDLVFICELDKCIKEEGG